MGLSLKEKVLWGLVLITLPLAWFLLALPKKEEAARIKVELSSLAKKAAEANRLLAETTRLREGAAAAQEKAAFLDVKVLSRKNVSRILEELSQDLQRHNLRILSMKPLEEKPPEPKALYQRLPVEIQVQGRYLDLGRYLEGMKGKSLLFTLDSMRLQKGESPYLTARFVLVAYMWRK